MLLLDISTLFVYVLAFSEAFLRISVQHTDPDLMQHTGSEESLKDGQNVDKECADFQRCMCSLGDRSFMPLIFGLRA